MRFLSRLKNQINHIPKFEGHGWWNKSKFYLSKILALNGDAKWLARSFAVGVFVSLTPFYGTHTITMLILIPLLHLNPAAALIGSMANLPWIAVFFYPFAFACGRILLGNWGAVSGSIPRTWTEMWSLMSTWQGLKEVLLPLVFGCLVLGAVVGLTTYQTMLTSIEKFRRRRRAGQVP